MIYQGHNVPRLLQQCDKVMLALHIPPIKVKKTCLGVVEASLPNGGKPQCVGKEKQMTKAGEPCNLPKVPFMAE